MRKGEEKGKKGGYEKAGIVESWDGGQAAGETLYLGSRQSPSFSRFYRKIGRERWRFEREYKRERAGQAIGELSTAPGDPAIIRRWVFGGVVFGTRQCDGGHLDRIVPYPWWRKFSGCDRFERLPSMPPVQQSIDRSMAWIENQVAPTIKTLQAVGYGNRVRDVVAAAKAKPSVMAATAPPTRQNVHREIY